MNWYKKAQIVTINTRLDTIINLSIKELLAIDDFVMYGKNEKVAKDILSRIIRENPGVFRMKAEDKIKMAQSQKTCPKCGGQAYYKEMHPDTSMNEIVLWCSKCGEVEGGELVRCPFCHDIDFDLAGLKSHLSHGDCSEFNKIQDVKRVL